MPRTNPGRDNIPAFFRPSPPAEDVLDTPVGQALREILGPDRQYAPNTLISEKGYPTEVEQQLKIVEGLSEGNPIEIGKRVARSKTASVRSRH